jgi:uncharacterized protein YraI
MKTFVGRRGRWATATLGCLTVMAIAVPVIVQVVPDDAVVPVAFASSDKTYPVRTEHGGPVNVRSGPGLGFSVVDLVNNGEKVKIHCTSIDGSGKVWDDISGSGRFVSDRYVKTGQSAPVAPTCSGPVAATPANPSPSPTPADPAPSPTPADHAPSPTPADHADAGGHGGVTKHWWGFTLWIDHGATGRLEALIAAGAGIAAVAAELTSWTGIGGVSGAGIAALLALGAGAIHLCDWRENGVNFHVTYFPQAAACWPR